MDFERIDTLLKLLKEHGVTEFSYQDEEGWGCDVSWAATAPAVHVSPASAARAPSGPADEGAPQPEEDDGSSELGSPMVGTFYRSPSPDADPYVQLGDRVKRGQVLCIIEAMKLMNEIESEVEGTVAAILVDNGQPVQFSQPLFKIKPD
jgi:acetyl-CoA carboxylase biotin carboxyl carrier protein